MELGAISPGQFKEITDEAFSAY
ncbi:hypothetical protein [Sporosarcina psychrophila]